MKKIFLTITLALFVIPFGMSQDLPSYVPTNGLVAYYPFNGNANDESGNGNHGTVNGATLANDQYGNENKAYEFIVNENGGWGSPQNEINISYNPLMNSNEITLSGWVYPRSKPGSFSNRPLTIFGRWADGISNESFRFQITYDQNTNESAGATSNQIFLQIHDVDVVGNTINNSEFFSGGNVEFDKWTHVAVTYDGLNGRVYQNGVLVAEKQLSSIINQGQSSLNIGSLKASNGTWYLFDGFLDELGYWSRALTENEVQNLYSSTIFEILLNGTVSAESNQIKNILDPTDPQDAVSMSFLLDKIQNLQDQIDALQTTTASVLVDNEGNIYPTINYGSQVWTVKNAEVESYRDGTPIPQVTDSGIWANLSTGAWKYYDNDPNKGKVYNWYAVAGIHDNDNNTPNKIFAPEGWHVPSDLDWSDFIDFLIANGYNYDNSTTENKIAKSIASKSGWAVSNIEGTPGFNQSTNNSSGFNIYPLGTVSPDGISVNAISNSVFWSSSEDDSENAWRRILHWGTQSFSKSSSENKKNGFSVRLVKD